MRDVTRIRQQGTMSNQSMRADPVQPGGDPVARDSSREGAATFTLPQLGIFAQGTSAHVFLEFDLLPGFAPAAAIAQFRRLRAPEVSSGGVNLVLGFSAAIWRAVAPRHAPLSLADFREVVGSSGRGAPATQHDAWLWISGAASDVTWSHARAAAAAVEGVASLAAEQAAFTYRDGRDITGFIDGTANPPTRLAPEVAMVPRGDPGEAGSHVLVMRWVHDLAAFERLRLAEQEAVFGRTKADSRELGPAIKPPTAHISRVEIEVGGHEVEIFRRSVPYGTVAEHGLYFVAFSAQRERYDRLLPRMFGTSGDGVHDRLTEFSRPVSGACYFAPSLNALAEVGGPE
jgi:putative iron-dependent peroxidase